MKKGIWEGNAQADAVILWEVETPQVNTVSTKVNVKIQKDFTSQQAAAAVATAWNGAHSPVEARVQGDAVCFDARGTVITALRVNGRTLTPQEFRVVPDLTVHTN